MKTSLKLILITLTALFAVVGSAFASPIIVQNVNVQNVNGNYVALVTLENQNVSSGVYSALNFSIEGMGSSNNVGPITVGSNGSVILQYNLQDALGQTNYGLLKQGQSYTLNVSADGNSATNSFLYGPVQTTSGLSLIINQVKLNGVAVSGNTLQVENGGNVSLQVTFTAQDNFNNARLMMFVEGYEHSPLIVSTPVFSVVKGVTYTKTLSLSLPSDMNSQQDYKLRIVGANDLSGLTYKSFNMYVDTQRNRVDVLGLITTPSAGVQPGQNVVADVRVENRGQLSQSTVQVSVSIPKLGVSGSSYLSNLNPGTSATSNDMLLYIPQNVSAGTYNAVVTLTYNQGYTTTSKNFTFTVLAPNQVTEKNLLVSYKNNVNLNAGKATTFNIVVANPNTDSKPISVVPSSDAWAEVSVTPTLAMVGGGQSQTYTVTVTPKDSVSGTNSLGFEIKQGATTLNQFTVDTYVTPMPQTNWLNVALAVLLVIAIIVLVLLVIVVARRKNDTEEEISSSEEYY